MATNLESVGFEDGNDVTIVATGASGVVTLTALDLELGANGVTFTSGSSSVKRTFIPWGRVFSISQEV
jgi:hypothetical protein